MRVSTVSSLSDNVAALAGVDAFITNEAAAVVTSLNRFGKLAWERTAWPFSSVLKQVVPDIRVRSIDVGAGGSQTAAFGAGGNPVTDATEEYDGSSWTSGGNIPVATRSLAGAGTVTAGLAFGGYSPSTSPEYTSATNEYNGSSWTAGGSLNTGRDQIGGTGASQNAAIAFAGGPNGPGVSTATEGYDGTSWSTRPNMATARKTCGSAGTNTLALAFGGYVPSPPETNATEEFTQVVETKTLTSS